MKINGYNIKGIKQAVGEYNRFTDCKHSIFFNFETFSVFCVPYEAGNILKEGTMHIYLADITEIIKDVYPENYKISMDTVKAVLREYVI